MLPFLANPLGLPNEHPLTFTALQNNSSVKLVQTGTVDTSGLYYKPYSSNTWLLYTAGTLVQLSQGQYVQFWNKKSTLSTSSSNRLTFVMTGSIGASGNVQALLNFSKNTYAYCFNALFSGCTSLKYPPKLPGKVSTNCYFDMFYGCTGLLEAPDLMDQNIGGQSYCRMFYNCTSLQRPPKMPSVIILANSLRHCYQMFYGCSSLTEAPQFTVNTVYQECFRSMFEGCSNLTAIKINLAATTLAATCYRGMCYNCVKLVNAPDLPATTLANECYMWMFGNCTSLKSCQVNFTSWTGATDATTYWMNNVPSGGTFTKPGALAEETGGSRIPSGWTVIDK